MSNAMNVATLLNADGTVKTTKYTAGGGGTTIVANFDGLIALTGMTAGSQAYVTATNKLFFYTGVGWYLIATVQNDAPSAITGVDGSYSLAIDGTATTITAVSTDPEGFPLTWTYTASGLGSIATVSQADNVFTVTPSTAEANTGSFTLTISVTDGINGAVSTISSFSLFFIISNSKYTTLLAKAVSTGDNNNITDASSNNHTITVAGDTYAGSFSPYRHGGYSTQFDGASDYLEIYNDSSLVLAGGQWTIECWVKPSGNYSTYRTIFAKRAGSTSYEGYLRLSTGVVSFYNGTNYESTTVLDANSWSHVAWVYVGGYINIYVNGVRVATSAVTVTDYNYPIVIGGVTGKNEWFQGNIRDFRILKGTALYTGTTLTPPTEPLTDITNTSLLICQLPYIVDVSTNAHAITVNGNVYTAPFNIYDYTLYSAGINGGSVYFGGVSDFLSIADDDADLKFGSDDFTLEMWYKGTDTDQYATLTAKGTGGFTNGDWSLMMNKAVAGDIAFYVHEYNTGVPMLITGDVSASDNAWVHIAVVRSGNDWNLYVNGVSEAYVDSSTTINGTSSVVLIGADHSYGRYLSGFISDYRIVKGTAVYTAAFTPPTAPLSSSGATLHIKGADASIIDKAQVNNLKLIGGPTGSTTQAKFANTKSIDFGLTSDTYVMEVPSGAGYTGEFTIEFWMYNTDITSTWQTLMSNSYANGSYYFRLYKQQNNGQLSLYHNSTGASLSSIGNIVNNTWTHVAIVRDSSNDITVYQDGTSIGSYNNSAVFGTASSPINVGKGGVGDSTNYPMSGYIQDLRITNGLARYTANFTPPTESLKG